jgi:hypothetical protein
MTPLKNWTGSSVWIHYRRMTWFVCIFLCLNASTVFMFFYYLARNGHLLV